MLWAISRTPIPVTCGKPAYFPSFFHPKPAPRFDCVSNEWNYSDLFDFKENVSNAPYLASDEFDEWDEFMTLEDGEISNLCPASEDGSPVQDQSSPGTRVDPPHLTLNVMSLVESLSGRFRVDATLLDIWLDGEEFFEKRYGVKPSGMLEDPPDRVYKGVGLPGPRVDLAVVQLWGAIAVQNPMLVDACDLSPQYEPEGSEFPNRSPRSVLNVSLSDSGSYIVAAVDGNRRWKLLIEDPLTILQIEREGWDLQANNLVPNLIRKGLPLKILYPVNQGGTVFHPHNGPIVHPPGKSPVLVDYLSYQLDLVDFFKFYPHAHVAALCSGGILWRIAVDVLPIPDVHDLIRPFPPECCEPCNISGEQYWTPCLSTFDAEMIVGVYKWSGKPSQ